MVAFFNKNNLKLSEKERTLVKCSYSFFNIPLLKIKEIDNVLMYLLFDFIPVAKVENSVKNRTTIKIFNFIKIK